MEGASPKVQWKCDHCQSIVFSGAQYRANIARIHLAASGSNGQCANLCTSKDSGAAERRLLFQSLIKKAEEKKAKRKRKLEQQAQRLVEREKQAGVNAMKRKKHQVKIPEITKVTDAAAANLAVAQWAFAHSIPANVMRGPYWKRMNKTLSRVSPSYVPMSHVKLKKTMLHQVKELAVQEANKILAHNPEAGRTITGDGATKGVPLINFLAHVPGKGVTLLSVVDCSEHMAEGGVKDAM